MGRSQNNDPNDARSIAIAIAALRSDRLPRSNPMITLECYVSWSSSTETSLGCAPSIAPGSMRCCSNSPPAAPARKMTVTKARDLLEQVQADDEAARRRVLIATKLIDDIA